MIAAGKFNPKIFLVLLSFAIGLGLKTATAQSLGLLVQDRNATTTRLTLTNATVSNVNLQGSFNLEDWFLLQSAAPVLGTATFSHTNSEPIDAWFYRAVAAPAPPTIKVGPMLDSNQSVGALIYPETGGRLEITDANGVFYQLTVRSNLVTEPTAIVMTVITNFTDMPLTNRFRAAVAFEPDGFEFRGAAELKIRFPREIPALEMVGYGFDGGGGDFHLHPWESDTNQVTLSVSHFSGTGVAAEPFPLTGNFNQSYERGLTSTRDAIREANNWAGDQYRATSRFHRDGKFTQQEAAESRRLIKSRRDRMVYENAVKPLLPAAARDCAVGEVVLKRLDQLEGESGNYGQGAFYQEILKVAPSVRCVCARYYLERCEKDPSASGISAATGLKGILDQVALMTGLIDDPNCDLGSDFEIQARMAKAKCHKPWEGTVRYTRIYRSGLTNAISDAGGSLTSIMTENDDLSYVGHIIELVEEDGDVLEEGAWQSWTFKLAGKLTASYLESDTATDITKDWTVTDTDVTEGLDYPAAEGKLMLRFDNGLFTSLSASAGLDAIQYEMPLRRTTERKVECRSSGNCPEAIPEEKTNFGNKSLSFAEAPNNDSPGVVATWANGSLKLILTRNKRENYAAPFQGHNETTETLTVQLFRASAP